MARPNLSDVFSRFIFQEGISPTEQAGIRADLGAAAPPTTASVLALVPVVSVAIDDAQFYETADGTDDAPRIRRALAYATTLPSAVVSFSSRDYNLLSTVPTLGTLPTGGNDLWPAYILVTRTGTKMRNFEILGNGARLLREDTTAISTLFLYVAAERIVVRGLQFILDGGNGPVETRAGLEISPVLDHEDVSEIIIEDNFFSNHNRSWSVGRFVVDSRKAYGKLKCLRVCRNRTTHPLGANSPATNTGGTDSLVSNWALFSEMEGNTFTGSELEDLSEVDGAQMPMDGWIKNHALNQLVRGNHVENFWVEGIYCEMGHHVSQTQAAFTVPSVGSNFSLVHFSDADYNFPVAGFRVGETLLMGWPRLVENRDVVPATDSWLLEVVAITGPNTMTVKNLNGPTGATTGYKPISLVSDRKKTSATVLGNYVRGGNVLPRASIGQKGMPGIAFESVDYAIATANVVDDCIIGIVFTNCIESIGADNIVNVDGTGISLTTGNPSAANKAWKASLTGNRITLSADLYSGVSLAPPAGPEFNNGGDLAYHYAKVGIKIYMRNALVQGNSISYADPTTPTGDGIEMTNGNRGCIIAHNLFENLSKDIGTGNVADDFIYTGNTLVNVTTPQNRFNDKIPLTLRLPADLSAPSTSQVLSSQSILVQAGTYKFEMTAVMRTASDTAGFNFGLNLSNTSADTIAIQAAFSISSADGDSVTGSNVRTYSRAGANLLQYIQFNFDGGASNKSLQGTATGMVTFSSPVTVKFWVSQRSATDGSNPSLLKANSAVTFTPV